MCISSLAHLLFRQLYSLLLNLRHVCQVGKGSEGRASYIRALTPETFDDAMRAEVKSLEQCFSRVGDGDSSSLMWDPPEHGSGGSGVGKWDCEAIRKDQLSLLGFQSKRLPGRLLMSLYPMHSEWINVSLAMF